MKQLEDQHRSGFINVLGFPNSGKSTLVNAVVGEKLSIISPKPQTTRHRIFAIHNEDDYQLIFSDTPGFVRKVSYVMHEKMNAFILNSFQDADLILLVIDASDKEKHWDQKLVKLLASTDRPVYLVINKIDLVDQASIMSIRQQWKDVVQFSQIFEISAKDKVNIAPLLTACKEVMPFHPPYFPKDELSDKSVRFFVSELVREQIFMLYQKEIPYSTDVIITSYKDEPDIARIRAEIIVERKTQKSIIIGKSGSSIKQLGIKARKEIEHFVGKKVFLELFVKVKENWRKNSSLLDQLGYKS